MILALRRRAFALALAGCLVAAGSAAGDAPSEAERAKARKLLDSATTHYNLGEWKEAITDYKECYRLVHNAVLLYNLGQAYRQDGQFESAVMFYRNYLRDEKDPPNRADVERLIKDTEAANATKKASPAINPTTRTANVDDAWTSTTSAPTSKTTATHPTAQAKVSASEIRVTLDSVWRGAPAVRFDVYDVRVANYLDKRIHFGFDVKQKGKALLWVGSPAVAVKFASEIWPAQHGIARTYYYKHQFLREKGDASQPFEAFFYVVDTDSGTQLYDKSVPFTLPAEGAVTPPPPAAPAPAATSISAREIRVDVNSSSEGQPAVRFEVMDVAVANQKGNTIHFGFNVRDGAGHYLQWKPQKAQVVAFDRAQWKGPTTFLYPHSLLQGARGPLVGRFYIMETLTGRELYTKDAPFSLP